MNAATLGTLAEARTALLVLLATGYTTLAFRLAWTGMAAKLPFFFILSLLLAVKSAYWGAKDFSLYRIAEPVLLAVRVLAVFESLWAVIRARPTPERRAVLLACFMWALAGAFIVRILPSYEATAFPWTNRLQAGVNLACFALALRAATLLRREPSSGWKDHGAIMLCFLGSYAASVAANYWLFAAAHDTPERWMRFYVLAIPLLLVHCGCVAAWIGLTAGSPITCKRLIRSASR